MALLVGAAIVLLRQPHALHTVWAEDGQVFLSQAVNKGGTAFTTSYEGYFHAVPRLLAAVLPAVSATSVASILAVEAALCTALVALLAYTASGEHLRSRLARVIVAAVVVAVPVGQSDVLVSIANLHWYGLYALFWVLIWTPRGRTGRVVAAVTVALVTLSDIVAVAFVPLAVWRFRRDALGKLLAGLLGVGLVVQLAGLVFGSSSRSGEVGVHPLEAVAGYVVRAVPQGLLGERGFGADVSARWLALAAVAWLILAGVAFLVWRGVTRPNWPLALCALAHSAALYILPVCITGSATPRYAVAPAMLLVVALVAVLEPADVASRTRVDGVAGRAAAPLLALGALLAVVWAINLRADNERAHGPEWQPAVRTARNECATQGVEQVDIPVSPRNADRWHARVPCSYL